VQNVLCRRNFCTNPYYIPYNKLVAAAFFRAGYIEAWGRGIEKINYECDLAGVSKPDYNYEFAGLMITFKTGIEEKTPGKTLGKTPGKTPLQILKILSDQPTLTIPEIAKMIKKSDSQRPLLHGPQ